VQAVAIHVNHRHLTLMLARAVKDAGFGLFCYAVIEPARARTARWGVDAFCTDLIGPGFADATPAA
jgi:glycerophosphoryl diester phosphodiesterase